MGVRTEPEVTYMLIPSLPVLNNCFTLAVSVKILKKIMLTCANCRIITGALPVHYYWIFEMSKWIASYLSILIKIYSHLEQLSIVVEIRYHWTTFNSFTSIAGNSKTVFPPSSWVLCPNGPSASLSITLTQADPASIPYTNGVKKMAQIKAGGATDYKTLLLLATLCCVRSHHHRDIINMII